MTESMEATDLTASPQQQPPPQQPDPAEDPIDSFTDLLDRGEAERLEESLAQVLTKAQAAGLSLDSLGAVLGAAALLFADAEAACLSPAELSAKVLARYQPPSAQGSEHGGILQTNSPRPALSLSEALVQRDQLRDQLRQVVTLLRTCPLSQLAAKLLEGGVFLGETTHA